MQILVVEDHLPFVPALLDTLRRLKPAASIRHVVTLAEAEAALVATSPELVLLDLGLPDASGLEILDRVRQQAPTARICIISATDERTLMREAFERGAHGYSPKSRTPAEFELGLRQFFETGFYFPAL